jgi:hypothetical protein
MTVSKTWLAYRLHQTTRKARKAIEDLCTREGLPPGTARYGELPCEGGACTLHIIASSGKSPHAITLLDSHILPHATRMPTDWLFLLESTDPKQNHPLDPCAVALRIARQLHIHTPKNPFVTNTDEETILALHNQTPPQGITEQDLRAACCYDILPHRRDRSPTSKGLSTKPIQESPDPRREALRLLQELKWNLPLEHMQDIVQHVLDRIQHESPWVLDDFYDRTVRPLLSVTACQLNRQRLKQLLERHPMHPHVLLMTQLHHLPIKCPTPH